MRQAAREILFDKITTADALDFPLGAHRRGVADPLFERLTERAEAISIQGEAHSAPWRLVIEDDATGSHFDRLLAAPKALDLGAPLAALALTGRGFHGHRGRTWVAHRGNLHLSLALCPDRRLQALGPGLQVLPAVASAQAIEETTQLKPGLKWVNDIWIDGAKVAGVLTSAQVQGDRVSRAVLGIGLNLARAPEGATNQFVPKVISLFDAVEKHGGPLPSLQRLTTIMLEKLWEGYQSLISDGPGPLVAAYRDRFLLVGKRVEVWEEGGGPLLLSGVVESLEDDLALKVTGEKLRNGRVVLLDPL